jgi:hypothetical protein
MIAKMRAAARLRLNRVVMAGDESVTTGREQRNEKAGGCSVTGTPRPICLETILFALLTPVSIARIKFFYRLRALSTDDRRRIPINLSIPQRRLGNITR